METANRPPRRYLRKDGVRERYGWRTTKSVDRAWKEERIPPPDLYQGKFPLWLEATLDAHDDEQRERNSETARVNTDAAIKASRRRRELEADAAE
jgi:hypothetical protein